MSPDVALSLEKGALGAFLPGGFRPSDFARRLKTRSDFVPFSLLTLPFAAFPTPLQRFLRSCLELPAFPFFPPSSATRQVSPSFDRCLVCDSHHSKL